MGVSPSTFYLSGELDALKDAKNYYAWILRHFSAHLGGRTLEVGAGIGSFSRFLLDHPAVSHLTLVEPADNLVPLLRQRFLGDERVTLVHGHPEDVTLSPGVDSAVLVNVLEHVAADEALLQQIHGLLVPGGRILLFVPALPWLHGSLDEAFGHVRRYTKASLGGALRRLGFDVIRLGYVNFPGVITWLIAGKVLRRRTLRPRDVWLYDRLVVPWLRRLEGRWPPPIGQSLVAVARK